MRGYRPTPLDPLLLWLMYCQHLSFEAWKAFESVRKSEAKRRR